VARERQVGISKQSYGYLRRLLVLGSTGVLRFARQNNASKVWAVKPLERKKPKVVAVAWPTKPHALPGVSHRTRTEPRDYIRGLPLAEGIAETLFKITAQRFCGKL
jgi:hypothetical protein